MRNKKRSEHKRNQSQTRPASQQKKTVDTQTIAAKLQELQKKADDNAAQFAKLERLVDQMDNGRDILLKKLDGIPLLPHEEAILDAMQKAITVQETRFKF